jgi:uncharacterized membrane protein
VTPPSPESRWPQIVTLLVLYALVADLPDHVRLLPGWVGVLVAAVAVGPMLAVALGGATPARLRMERVAVLAMAGIIATASVVMLAVLIGHIIGGASPMSGLRLLSSSVVVWACNVVGFGLLYWQLDGGGPAGRAAGQRRDWLFPQAAAGEAAPPAWRPVFVDYLYLAFSTATAFSTTDAAPLTPRAKVLMMLEAAVALTTMVVVASRAINVLAN